MPGSSKSPGGARGAGKGSLRSELTESDGSLLVTFILIPRPETLEIAAGAGFDGVILDLEHGPYTLSDLPPLVAAAQGAGIFALVRVGEFTEASMAAVLDLGVDGILVPHVGSPEAAARVVAAGRFPPDGIRSINPYVRALGHMSSGEDPLGEVNRRTALIAMIEGHDGLANLEEICAVEGLDGVFVGAVDMSADLGYPNEPEHPVVVERITAVVAAIGASGKAAALYAPTPDAAARWLARGVRLVALSADSAVLFEGLARLRAGVEEGV